MFKLRQRVALKNPDISEPSEVRGTVNGTATTVREDGTIEHLYVVLLEHGFWNPARDVYISAMIIHPDNLLPV